MQQKRVETMISEAIEPPKMYNFGRGLGSVCFAKGPVHAHACCEKPTKIGVERIILCCFLQTWTWRGPQHLAVFWGKTRVRTKSRHEELLILIKKRKELVHATIFHGRCAKLCGPGAGCLWLETIFQNGPARRRTFHALRGPRGHD